MTDQQYMRHAINLAREAVSKGELPFGAILVGPDGGVVLGEHDRVAQYRDPTWHAETHLVKQACAKFGPDLSGFTLYTTCEPCAMCFTTAWLARVGRIVAGTNMADVHEKGQGEISEMPVTMQQMNKAGGNRIEVTDDILADECLALFDEVGFGAPVTKENAR